MTMNGGRAALITEATRGIGRGISRRLIDSGVDNAAFLLCRWALAPMRAQGFGRIVNIGASSKNYLEEIGNGITVNMVAPSSNVLPF